MFEELNHKCILITGSRGYIAHALQQQLAQNPCHLIRVTRAGNTLLSLEGLATVEDHAIELDDDFFWKTLLPKVDVIFHLAAQTSVAEANQSPLLDWEGNLKPLITLLENCKTLKTPPILIFSSSAAIYGSPTRFPVDESFGDQPLSIYECHKLMAEQYINYYTQRGYVRGVNLRLANVYGPGVNTSRQDRSILNQMIVKAIHSEPLTIYGNGKFLRDYIYIEDVANAFLLAASHISQTCGHTYIISSGIETYFSDVIYLVAKKVSEQLGHLVEVKHIDPPKTLTPVDLRHFTGSSLRFHEDTGWQPSVGLEKGIELTIDFLHHSN